MENEIDIDLLLQPHLRELADKTNMINIIFKHAAAFEELYNDYKQKHQQLLLELCNSKSISKLNTELTDNLFRPFYLRIKTKNQPQITPQKTPIEQEITSSTPTPSKKRGRPLGSKNKPKTKSIILPIHTANKDNVEDAILDLLHYKNNQTYKQIYDHLILQDITPKHYALIFFNLQRNATIKKLKIKNVELWYTDKRRKGYFYKNNLYTLDELEEISGIDRATIYKRIKSGLNIYEALEKPVRPKIR